MLQDIDETPTEPILASPRIAGVFLGTVFMLLGNVGLAALWIWMEVEAKHSRRFYIWLGILGASVMASISAAVASRRVSSLQARHPNPENAKVQEYGTAGT